MPEKIPVRGLYAHLDKMLADHWGYIWGTAGKLWTAQLQANPPDDMAKKYGERWIGHMVADCSGVMVYIWRQYGLTIPHGSNSIARKSVGRFQTSPAPGFAAFKWRPTDTDKWPDGKGDYYHIGIVGADGRTVYESKGTILGFVTRDASEWDYFAPFKDVDYNEGVETMPQTETQYTARVTTQSGGLRLRSGAGTGYPIITTIPRGATVEVLMEFEVGWDFVRYGKQTGYVSAEYLTPINGAETPSEPTKEPDVETPTGMTWGVFIGKLSEERAKEIADGFPGSILTMYKGGSD